MTEQPLHLLSSLFALHGAVHTGVPARDLFRKFGSLSELVHAAPEVLSLHGASPEQIEAITAFRNLHREVLTSEAVRINRIFDADRMKRHLTAEIGHAPVEHFHVLYISTLNELLDSRTHWSGSFDSTPVYVREIVRTALTLGASQLILAHNHPSGLAEPSRADRVLTGQICRAAKSVELRVVDHWIFAGRQVFSFFDHGLI